MATQGLVFERRRDCLRWLFGNVDATPTPPASIFAALFNTDPGDAAVFSGTEVTGTAYARVSIGVGTANWTSGGSAGNPATMVQDAVVNFGTVGAGGWTTASWIGLMDASTAGNLIARIPITGAPVTLSAGATVTIAISTISVTANFNP